MCDLRIRGACQNAIVHRVGTEGQGQKGSGHWQNEVHEGYPQARQERFQNRHSRKTQNKENLVINMELLFLSYLKFFIVNSLHFWAFWDKNANLNTFFNEL